MLVSGLTKERAFVAIGLVFTLLYLLLVYARGSASGVGMGGLFIAAAGMLYFEKAKEMESLPVTSIFSRGIAVLILVGVISVGVSFLGYEDLNYVGHPERILPFFTLVALTLMFYGRIAFEKLTAEYSILLGLGLPPIILNLLAEPIAVLTANTGGMFLWYFGFEANVVGRVVYIPGGAVQVTNECSGYLLDAWLIGLAIAAQQVVPLKNRAFLVLLPLVGLLIGVFTNTIRISILAVLTRLQDEERFEYWHSHDGSQIFGLFGIGLFMLLYWLLLKRQDKQEREMKERQASSAAAILARQNPNFTEHE